MLQREKGTKKANLLNLYVLLFEMQVSISPWGKVWIRVHSGEAPLTVREITIIHALTHNQIGFLYISIIWLYQLIALRCALWLVFLEGDQDQQLSYQLTQIFIIIKLGNKKLSQFCW